MTRAQLENLLALAFLTGALACLSFCTYCLYLSALAGEGRL